jgi:hypothetical protein
LPQGNHPERINYYAYDNVTGMAAQALTQVLRTARSVSEREHQYEGMASIAALCMIMFRFICE